jgi:hypothetical protein
MRFIGSLSIGAGLALATLLAPAALAQMQLPDFQRLAGNNESRCVGARDTAFCQGELRYARDQGLITQDTFDWGMAHEYYPVVSRLNTVEAVCRCGCFEQSTQILATDPETQAVGFVAVRDLSRRHLAWALASDATLASLKTTEQPIVDLVHGPEEAQLVVFRLADGRVLKLTQHHGAVLSDGRVVAASDVSVGQSFIDASTGATVEIVAIDHEPTSAEVYNFKVAGDDNVNHVVIAEGLLVGDLSWQNGLARELGAVQIRR